MPSLSPAALRCWQSHITTKGTFGISNRARLHLLSSFPGVKREGGGWGLLERCCKVITPSTCLQQSRPLFGQRQQKFLKEPLHKKHSFGSSSKQSADWSLEILGLDCPRSQLHSGILRSSKGYTTAMPTDAQVKDEALSIIKQAKVLPSIVVFDLDYTIWPFWCEVKTTKSQPRLYPEVRGIVEALKEAQIPLAIASRTPSPNIATVFLSKLQLTSYFKQKEIYPTISHKTEHFKALVQGTKVPYAEMLFFDDEDRNVITISPLGVKCVLVEDGVNLNALREGVAKFQTPNRR